MTKRSRILGYGGSGVLVIAGILCAIVLGATLGTVLAFILVSAGLVLATSLVFLEVGLSEDHERAREEKARAAERKREAERAWASQRERERQVERESGRAVGRTGPRPRLSRLRGERRRLK
jgi:hypothetical protein